MTHTLERTWIDQISRRFPQADLRHDTFFDPTTRQILTTDMLVEGVHFSFDYCSPEDVGWKSLAVSLSDIAATGGDPQWALVSLGSPPGTSLDTMNALYNGLQACAEAYRVTLIGGDTVRSPQMTLAVTLTGTLSPRATPGRRHTAQPGDVLVISGAHGLSRTGLTALQQGLPNYETAKQAHLRPQPRLKLGKYLASALQRYAMMDTSDGLADAAMRLAEASGVDIVLDINRIPIPPDVATLAAAAGESPLDWVLYGGEDFELAVALPPEAVSMYPELIVVGSVRAAQPSGKGQGWLQTGSTREPLSAQKTFQHFAPAPNPDNGDT